MHKSPWVMFQHINTSVNLKNFQTISKTPPKILPNCIKDWGHSHMQVEKRLLQHILTKSSPFVRPVKDRRTPTNVTFGFEIKQIPSIVESQQTIKVNIFLRRGVFYKRQWPSVCPSVTFWNITFFVWENLTSVSERYIFGVGFFWTYVIFSYFHTSVSEQHIFTNDQ